jgi:hypothetical protein
MIRALLVGLLLGFLPFPSFAVSYGPYSLIAPIAVDGDTVKASIAIFPGLYYEASIRIVGVDTPEINGKCTTEKEGPRQRKHLLTHGSGRTHQSTLPTFMRILTPGGTTRSSSERTAAVCLTL